MSFENTSVADPKTVKNVMTRLHTKDCYEGLMKSSAGALDEKHARRYVDLFQQYTQKNPLLLQCDILTISTCLKTAASFGLEPGLLGMLYIVPFKNNNKGIYEAQVILGYRGVIELTRRSKAVKHVEAVNVYEADLRAPGEFKVIRGLNPDLIHVPNWKASHNGQKPIGSYCVSVLAGGDRTFTFMTQEEIEAIRQRSRAKDNGPWITDPGEMYRKSVTKRHCKYLPMSVEDLTLMGEATKADFDVDPDELETRGGVPIPVASRPIEIGSVTSEKAVEGSEVAPVEQEKAAQASAPEAAPVQEAAAEQKAAPVAGTQGMKDAISKKRGRPKKSGAEVVPPADVPQESAAVGAQPPAANTPAPAPEAPKAETPEAPAAPKWVVPAEEKTEEDDDERIIRYEKELADADDMPTTVLAQRANFAWTHVEEADQQAVLKLLGMTVEQIKAQDTLKMRKNLIIASATVIKQRLMKAKAAEKAEAKQKPAETKATEAASDPLAIKVNSLLEGHQQLDLEALRARAKQMVALAKEVRPDDVKAWLYDLMIEKEEELDICRQIGLKRLLESFAKNLTSKEE